jgi:diguanylate cyclase (GGDEF)-like protein/PAS domain S-box-containing protein
MMKGALQSSGHMPFARRFVPVFSIFVAISLVTLLLALAALEVQSTARSYVAGEGMWSKGQRDAVHALTMYGLTRDPAYFRRYRAALQVPLGDHRARLEMEQADFDYDVAYAGFLQGGNSPDDIPGMIRLFRCCARYSYFGRAVGIWQKADVHIARLEKLGDRLHAEVTSTVPERTRVEQILVQVRANAAAVQPLENAFSATLGEAMRSLNRVLAWSVTGIVLALIAAGAFIGLRVLAGIRAAESRYRIVVDALVHTGEGMMILDADRRIVDVNPTHGRITGFSPDETIGTTLTHPAGKDVSGPTYEAIWQRVDSHGAWEGELWGVRKSGEIFPQRLSISAVRDDHARTSHYVAVFNDISPYRAYEEKLEHLARHDALTGLANRAEFERQCREAISRARRSGHSVAVLFVDLDGFKIINDVHGHAAGDDLLRIIAARMAAALRQTDLVARLGGDEFGVLVGDMDDAARSAAVARKLIDALTQPVVTPTGEHVLGASIGISLFPDDGEDVAMLLQHADGAMYQVKQSGGNDYRFRAQDAGDAGHRDDPGDAARRN